VASHRLVVHGGVGTHLESVADAERKGYLEGLTQALQAGHAILARGDSALDAVEAAVRVLEDAPLFNAGRGAVFTSAGTHELDAAIMDGSTLRAGAVAAVQRIANPIRLARMVMEQSTHVMLVGDGAEAFARERGLPWVDPSYFRVEARWVELERARREAAEGSGHLGTVGAVALDGHGNLAAATSTGGMTNKRLGRVGDSPIFGAGTYADNGSCAVSATGQGEYFIRTAAAHDLGARVRYDRCSVEAAARAVIERIGRLGGQGGVIAVDGRGEIALVCNTAVMFRGRIGADGHPWVAIESGGGPEAGSAP
jgi:beta-aspartyl-peptidase (threonine type)